MAGRNAGFVEQVGRALNPVPDVREGWHTRGHDLEAEARVIH